ncbi:alpha-hydroxy-acid oxidizing protein [Solirubrobacter sp. CPCC 204708]|uniref:Alpha-hydroxy-acid oxidizing protein n=1 Tax=Solirubrobacter deserti TaxID=2282478 RepID=A0ABT4RG00_9ACTN|nr:alpha-hydroxy acid oxidase [Solirubrobacter deserti]MBE2319483.1 alpha-hydroxy-acid oxidizing protein [Solirubrobacter deserti]MDA0137230.1 alpha-hydroxy-acid oxidizing protein [Solirubrobacter deserti]
MSSFATAGEVAEAARAALPPEVWDYVSGGGGTEVTLRRNRAALDALLFRPRVLRDVSARRTDTTFLGLPIALPVLLAPIGTIGLFDAGGAATCARAAARAGTGAFVGILSVPSLEEVAAAAPDAPLIFQHYVRGDREWTLELFKRAEAAGYRALCITVDSAVDGIRERDLRNRFDRSKAQDRPNLGTAYARRELQATLTWSEIAWLAEQTELPLMIKGVTHPDDAKLAIESGAAAVVVSNHGGRQLDPQPGALEVLPDVVAAAGGRLEVAVDGGFERGGDVVKALALGARAVLIGKAMCFSLAAGGEAALVETLTRLRTEVERTFALLGVTAPDDVRPEHVRPAPWPTPPHAG